MKNKFNFEKFFVDNEEILLTTAAIFCTVALVSFILFKVFEILKSWS